MGKQLDVVVIGNTVNETIVFPDKTIGPVLEVRLPIQAWPCLRLALVGLVTYYGPDLNSLIREALLRLIAAG